MPLCLSTGRRRSRQADHRRPLASPETGPNDSWWLAVGEAEPRAWRVRLPVVSSLPARCQLIDHMSRAWARGRGPTMKKTLLAAALLGTTLAAHAADQNDAATLDPVIVTATRTAITVDNALSSVTVITRADIERLQPRVAAGPAGRPAGRQPSSNAAASASRARCSCAAPIPPKPLVLVDGVRIGSATRRAGRAGADCRWSRSSASKSCAARAPACTVPTRSAA